MPAPSSTPSPDAITFYAKYGFVTLEALEGQAEARPQPTPMFLSMRAIQSTLGPRGNE